MAEKYGYAKAGAITYLLVMDYLKGLTIEELHQKYGINTSTISIYLRTSEVIRRLFPLDPDAVICDIAMQRKENIKNSYKLKRESTEKGKSK